MREYFTHEVNQPVATPTKRQAQFLLLCFMCMFYMVYMSILLVSAALISIQFLFKNTSVYKFEFQIFSKYCKQLIAHAVFM